MTLILAGHGKCAPFLFIFRINLSNHNNTTPSFKQDKIITTRSTLLQFVYTLYDNYEGVDPKTVQYLAGHENSKTTMDIYAQVKYNKPSELRAIIDDALKTKA